MNSLPVLIFLLIAKYTFADVAFNMVSGYMNPPYIGFRTLATSVGGDVVLDLGTFKAQNAGVYFFSFTALSNQNKSLRISLRKNRRPIVTGFADELGFKSFTLNAVVKVNQGDLIYTFVEDGEIYESTTAYRAFTSFSGFQIFSTQGGGFFNLLGRSEGNRTEFHDNELPLDDLNDDIYERLKNVTKN